MSQAQRELLKNEKQKASGGKPKEVMQGKESPSCRGQ